MIALRLIAAVVLVLLLIFVGGVVWTLFAPDAGSLDVMAARRIRRSCGFEAECKVKIGDLFDGQWDTFYEFGSGMSQTDVDSILGAGVAPVRGRRRIVVMTQNGRVELRKYEADGSNRPLDGEVLFEDEHHREQRSVRYTHEQWLRVHSFAVDPADERRGTYFVLTAAGPNS